MARNRLNPWPSIADLFSALTVVAFAALIVVTVGAVMLTKNERTERDAGEELARVFARDYPSTSGEPVQPAACEDRSREQCIEIAFRFKPGISELTREGVREVKQACEIYREAVKKVIATKSPERNVRWGLADFGLLIEGNTDTTIPPSITDARERFLYNWKLSSDRAASVLYEFSKCGVSPAQGYRIRSVGLADTNKRCDEPNPDKRCHERNRRTTMRIRVERNNR